MSIIETMELDIIKNILKYELNIIFSMSLDEYRMLVNERDVTGVGFNTDYVSNEKLRIINTNENLGLGKLTAHLNENVLAGFLLKIEEGQITWLEGYTLDDQSWPENITDYTLAHSSNT